MTKHIEDRMELLSAGATDGKEYLLEEWREGTYSVQDASQTLRELQSGEDLALGLRFMAAVYALGRARISIMSLIHCVAPQKYSNTKLTSNRGSNTGT